MTNNNIPEGSRQIEMSELLAAIGELYVQTKIQRELIQQLQEKISATQREGSLPSN